MCVWMSTIGDGVAISMVGVGVAMADGEVDVLRWEIKEIEVV